MIHQFDPSYATYADVDDRSRRDGKPRRTEPTEKSFGADSTLLCETALVMHFLDAKA